MKIHPLVALLTACAASTGLIALASSQADLPGTRPAATHSRIVARPAATPSWNDAGDTTDSEAAPREHTAAA